MPLADETALGLLETHGLVAGIEAADAMLKTALVRLVSIEKTVPALITIKIVGEVAAVQAAVDAGRAAAERVGRVVSAHMIPRPSAEVRGMMRLDAEHAVAPAGNSSNAPDFASMTVRELRAAVRDIPDFPIQGREVARARKDELIEHLRKHRGS